MFIRPCILTTLCCLLPACEITPAVLAPDFAQPKTAPARNFTSFDGALRCMDRLLAAKGQQPVYISSTGIPDETRRISVAADDMLINALNRMNRTSHAYIFLDQGLVRADGLIDLLVVQRENPPRPSYYIRGAISQLDGDVGVTDVEVGFDDDILDDEDFIQVEADNRGDLSVVSVDLHLVAYPSRQIVPGASVSNSMVVRERRFGLDAFGLIAVTGLEFDLQIDRIESNGQAVRNLIEVSAIELIGRHSGIPFWKCLSGDNTNARLNSGTEHQFVAKSESERVIEAQRALITLKKLAVQPTGKLDKKTRSAIAVFQAEENLLVNGRVDFDTLQRLKERALEGAKGPKPVTTSTKPKKLARTSKNNTPGQASTANSATSEKNTSSSNRRIFLPPDAQRSQRTERNDAGFIPLDQFLRSRN